ncbi:hypothetical protein [Alkalihalobacillus deserti]|nr:hypothetical protein [Alkalihalobacillus deserti]
MLYIFQGLASLVVDIKGFSDINLGQDTTFKENNGKEAVLTAFP